MSRKTIKSNLQDRGGPRPESIKKRDVYRRDSKLMTKLNTPSNHERLIALYKSKSQAEINRGVTAIDCWQRRPGFDRVYNREGKNTELCLKDCLKSIEDMELESGCIIFAPLSKFRDTQASVILTYDKCNDGDDDITHMILELTLQLDLRS